MKIIDTSASEATPIERFESRGAASVALGSGSGACHVYAIHIEPGGEIGPHEAGFDQLWIAVEGEGWGAGADGERQALPNGGAMVFRRGEVHSKGSDTGMKAIMIQMSTLDVTGDGDR